MSNPGAMPIGHITISYTVGDDEYPHVGVEAEGYLDTVTLLGMLRMAEDTILSPKWDDSEEDQ